MPRINLSNGKEVNLYSSRFIHVVLTLHATGDSEEIGGFQNGEAFSSQRTNAAVTQQGDFHGNSNFFDSEDESGQMTFNTMPASSSTEKFGTLFDWQQNSQPGVDDFINITVTNADTGQIIAGEGGRIQGIPQDQANETAFSLPWVVLFSRYTDNWRTPKEPMYADLSDNTKIGNYMNSANS
ncbi:hypothetical protein [Lentilactobacillus kosonis]|uniref:Uncharacterized protein n=1 Tax=Lentilactobacillus kosonis TaxID=2810561 RepID=A0A401FPZ4_9LACO|nr:hypothetical protein [Lentilactobacillus kosonis]GAY74281.1 hypothetical protein NBRC111893_2427 [Lentilactobacillus kosonis]